MNYLLILHGNWLIQTGKIGFLTLESLMEFLAPILKESEIELRKYFSAFKAVKKMENSYTIVRIPEDERMKKLFFTAPLTDQKIIFTKSMASSNDKPRLPNR